MKAIMITAGSFALTTGVLMNAYLQKKQFYPSVVYITKSSPSMAVLYVQAFVFVILMGKLIRKVFFGQLRAAEMEHLIERSWYAVTETCLAFTVFRDDFSPRFVALFTLLLFLKSFHWLAEDRIDYMERSPLISLLFHMRAIGLICLLGLLDAFFVNHAYYSTLMKGASVQLVFGFEYAILFTVAVHILVKYILHTVDLQSENPWESKAVYLLYTELVLGFVKVVLYMAFLFIMIKVHTFPLFAIRPMYLTLRSFKKALNDVIMSRRAIRNMNTLYPDATEEELAQGDNVCIICREEMAQGCKKLPCNHIFHTSCLRSWFQRQQTCPTCRMDVLRPAARRPSTPQAQPAAQQPPHPHQPVPGLFPFPHVPHQPGFPPMWPHHGHHPHAQHPHHPHQPHPQQPGTSTAASSTAGGASASATSSPTTAAPQHPGAGMMPPMPGMMPSMPGMMSSMMPPFMMPPFMMPFTIPPPTPGPNFAGLSDEEVRAMEGQERQSVEARIQCLRNIQTLLDAAVVQMQQYSSLVQSMQNTPVIPRSDNTTVTTSTKTTPTPVASGGARPKTSQSSSAQSDKTETDGAVGNSLPTVENIPEWSNSKEDESSELTEIRRRRLERFSEENKNSNDDNLDLD